MRLNLAMFFVVSFILVSCGENKPTEKVEIETAENADDFQYMTEQFADIKIIRYQIPSWDELPLQEKKLAYYLSQAGLAGRDMIYDQNYRNNLAIRRALESAYKNFDGDKSSDDWIAFDTYMKEIWFANGIHHHYSHVKFQPEFSREFLTGILTKSGASLSDDLMAVIFDPAVDAKKVSKDAGKDIVLASSVNFYDPDLTQTEVDAYYKKKMADRDTERPISYGLNSKLVKGADGKITEQIYKVGGMYGEALTEVIKWLELAKGVADNAQQAKAIGLLIDYYKTGDLHTWDKFNIAWVEDTTSVVDFIHGFVEVYNDPLGYRGSYESIVQIRDLDASEKMKVLSENAQYFEDNSPIMDEHKKEKVVGISYNFINVAGEAGDASPSTPIGVNLPNANWIRAEHGSKSISLGNIVSAYSKAGTTGFLEEFSNDTSEIALSKKYGKVSDKLHTALHEVIGHASGKINPGVGTPKQTLINYASTIEEARADLVALYYLLDTKLIEMGVMDDLDAGRHAYDDYIKNGLMLQLRRLKPGDVIEEDHMRNRQLVAAWVFEKGQEENVISKVKRDGNTYFEINDYGKLRALFGDLLRDIQRITSEGDFEAAKNLVETYGVQVDPEIHAEMLARSEKFDSAPYGGFINPMLVPVVENGEITDIKVEYPEDFAKQMLRYAADYTTLPNKN
ncbi:dihydrofolate reductase [Cryomorpha ignava]|uniref:Dihydrofolate reductase n=2 Tax=Cryomorpha ignava TaxID=101383 RepID=A0A7K3WLH0_9FLAO|nr:dihydrofolate reductase [Cryomorpha ignava]